ncbi:MAG: hypothetical protein L3J28_00035 [Candidatus Polarisedimenticolaceae bacterium]|nr:hypothetical protein [Candidatus Polarisedimenticolaceae bacterium]
MKRFIPIINFALLGLVFAMSGARAQPPIIDTDKSMYNLDPYFWVYSAARYEWLGVNPNLWPMDGHDISVGFSLEGYSGSSSYLTFSVEGLAEPVEGLMEEHLGEDGIYRGAFVVTEASVGGELFKPGEKDSEGASLLPRAVTLTISDADGAVAARQIKITRWGCDRCHMAKTVARDVYSWSNPAGGPLGPHSWPNVLGRNGGRPGFDYNNLTNDRLTHTPTVGGYVTDSQTGEQVWRANPLDRPPYHQLTNTKVAGGEGCSPCHQGSGRVRHAYGGIEGMNLYLSRERSLTVKCVFCHSLDSGYVPDSKDRPMWENWVLQGWN